MTSGGEKDCESTEDENFVVHGVFLYLSNAFIREKTIP
jgi:hypothetical protein